MQNQKTRFKLIKACVSLLVAKKSFPKQNLIAQYLSKVKSLKSDLI